MKGMIFLAGAAIVSSAAFGGAAANIVPQVQSYSLTLGALPPEGYRIRIDEGGAAKIEAADDAGRFYAAKTLKQLGPVKGPLEIEDYPAYRWRGVHLDESRHFFGKETVKKLIRTMAGFKLNILHWHIIDDSGWRIEIPGYPEVTGKGATRRAKKGKRWLRDLADGDYGPFFYTANDIREVLKVARENFVKVVPEVEIPGHAGHLLAKCYPKFACDPEKPSGVFCLGNDEAIAFLEAVVDTVVDLFPGTYVHIGGDEVNRKVWSKCAKCRARAKALGLKSTDDLQNWVTKRFAAYLAKRGRRIVGWDEIADGGDLPKSVVVMDWCGKGRGAKAAAAGHDIVVCHHWSNYFDYTQCVKDDPVPYPVGVPPVPVSKVYRFDPLQGIVENCRARVLGGQCCNWTEWTCTAEELEWKLWPRACAIAENYWTAPKKKDYAEFARRLEAVRADLVKSGVNAAPIAPEDGVYLNPRPKKLKLTLGTLTVPTNVVSGAICTFVDDKTIADGAYEMEIHYSRGITVRASGDLGRMRAIAALKVLARPDGENLDKLSFSCMEIADGGAPCPAEAVKSEGFSPRRFVAAEQKSGTIGIYCDYPGREPTLSWVWSAKSDPNIRPEDRRFFGVPDECKMVDGGKLVLMNDSLGGFAGIDVMSARCVFYGNAGGNPHSIERLPDGRIAVASSTGKTLKIFDVKDHPFEPKKQKSVTALELVGGHGVVWDAKRDSLFALGYTNLYELAYIPATMSVKVKKVWDFTKSCRDERGHDLLPDGKGGYYFSNHSAIWHFDPESEEFSIARELGNVKSFSPSESGELVAIPRQSWWTDTLLVFPCGSSDWVKARKIVVPGARFYKARWL